MEIYTQRSECELMRLLQANNDICNASLRMWIYDRRLKNFTALPKVPFDEFSKNYNSNIGVFYKNGIPYIMLVAGDDNPSTVVYDFENGEWQNGPCKLKT